MFLEDDEKQKLISIIILILDKGHFSNCVFLWSFFKQIRLTFVCTYKDTAIFKNALSLDCREEYHNQMFTSWTADSTSNIAMNSCLSRDPFSHSINMRLVTPQSSHICVVIFLLIPKDKLLPSTGARTICFSIGPPAEDWV